MFAFFVASSILYTGDAAFLWDRSETFRFPFFMLIGAVDDPRLSHSLFFSSGIRPRFLPGSIVGSRCAHNFESRAT